MLSSDQATKVYQKLVENTKKTTKVYFRNCLIGYMLSMLVTIGVMLFFKHGQPALLYLVPGVCLSVIITALVNGEIKVMWEHSEDKFVGNVPEEKEEKDAGSEGKEEKEASAAKKEKKDATKTEEDNDPVPVEGKDKTD